MTMTNRRSLFALFILTLCLALSAHAGSWAQAGRSELLNTELLRAAASGDLRGVHAALGRGANPDIRGKGGDHPINLAADAGHCIVCQALINAGADIDAFGARDKTPLMAAAEAGNNGLLELLLRHNAPLRLQNELHETALLLAARHGNTSCVLSLLNAGADPSQVNRDGETPLMCAAAQQMPDEIKLLLVRGASPNARDNAGRTALFYAVQSIAPAGTKRSPRETAAMLLATSDSPAQDGALALLLASKTGNTDTIKGLIDEDAPINAALTPGLFPLILSPKLTIAELKHEWIQGMTPLMLAAACGNKAVLKVLLDAHANAGARDTLGQTAIMYSARYGRVECARLLIQHGVDIGAVDDAGLTPLMHVAEMSSADARIVNLLISAGADPAVKDKRGETAEDIALRKGNKAVASAIAGRH